MAGARPQPIPGVTLDAAGLDFWYSMPADVQARVLAAKNPQDFPRIISELSAAGVHTWSDLKANEGSQLGAFQFYGIPVLQQGAQTVNATASAATTVGDFLGRLSDPHMWSRILMVTVGGALVVAALITVVRPAGIPSVASLAKKVVK